VFIVGMPRSGTTLTEQICASHSDVHGAGELTKIARIAQSIGYAHKSLPAFHKSITNINDETTQKLAGEYLSYSRLLSPRASRIVDKMLTISSWSDLLPCCFQKRASFIAGEMQGNLQPLLEALGDLADV